jgi:hypothetical protein
VKHTTSTAVPRQEDAPTAARDLSGKTLDLDDGDVLRLLHAEDTGNVLGVGLTFAAAVAVGAVAAVAGTAEVGFVAGLTFGAVGQFLFTKRFARSYVERSAHKCGLGISESRDALEAMRWARWVIDGLPTPDLNLEVDLSASELATVRRIKATIGRVALSGEARNQTDWQERRTEAGGLSALPESAASECRKSWPGLQVRRQLPKPTHQDIDF